jgi:acyl carrier protein
MKNQEVWPTLRAALALEYGAESEVWLKLGYSLKDLGVDSVTMFEILDLVEDRFGVTLSDEEAAAFDSLDDVVRVIESRLQA